MPDSKKRFVVVEDPATSPILQKAKDQKITETESRLKSLQEKVQNRTATQEEINLYNYNVTKAKEFINKVDNIRANADNNYSTKAGSLFTQDFAPLNDKNNFGNLFSSLVNSPEYQKMYSVETPAYPGSRPPAGRTPVTGPELMFKAFEDYKNNFTRSRNSELSKVDDYVRKGDYKSLYRIANSLTPSADDKLFTDYTKEKIGNKASTYIKSLAKTLDAASMLSNSDDFRVPEVRNTIDQKNRVQDALSNPEYLKRIGRELLKQEVGTKLYNEDQAFIHEVQSVDNPDNDIDYEATQVAINALKNLSAIDYRSKIAEYSRLKLYADKTGQKVDLEKADNALKEAENVLKTAENFDPDNFLKNNYKQTYLKIKENEEQGEKRRLGYDYWKKDYPNLSAALDYIPFPDLVKTWQATKSGVGSIWDNTLKLATGLIDIGDSDFEKAENMYTLSSVLPEKRSYTIGVDEEGKPVESSQLYWTDKQGKLHVNGYAIIETGLPVAEQMLETIVLAETGGLLLRGAGSALSLAGRTALGAERAALIGESLLGTRGVGSAAKLLTNPEVYNRALTFSSVYATTYPRIYAEEYNNFKNKENALNVAKMRSTVEALTESIIPNTADLFSRGSKGLLGLGRRSYTQDLTAGLDGVVGGMFPGASSKFVKNLGESMAFRRAMGYGKDLFQEAVVEEEASLIGNYFVDKYAKSVNKDYVEQNELTWENIVRTGIESAAAMLLTAPFMGGGKKSTIEREDTDAITSARWNIANNPDLYKSVVASQVKAGEITQEQAVQRIAKIDQYVKALETLPIKNLSSIRDMKTLLENKDAQYDFFSKHLQKQALLEYVPTDEELPAYTRELEKIDAELYKTQKLADKYDALSIQEKKKIIFDNFKDKTNTLLNADDVSPVTVMAQLNSAALDYKKNKNRLFGTELQGYMLDLQAAVEAVIPKFKAFISNNNEGLTPEQREYKARLLFANQGFLSKEEIEDLFNVLNKSANVAYAPLFSIQNEDEFIESLSRNYVTADTNKKPLTSDGELLFDKIRDQYIEDKLFDRFVEGLSKEEAKTKKDELKNRFWARVVELKQNQRDGQAFPEVAAPPVTQEEKFEAAASETQSKYQPLIANYREAVEKDLTEDQQDIREDTIVALIAEESVEDLVKALGNVQSIFIGDNLKKIAEEVQEGKTDKLVEFLEDHGATKKQIEKLLNKLGKPAEEVKTEVKSIEDKKADIERRRQQELNSVKIKIVNESPKVDEKGNVILEGGDAISKINEKYDAELKALEKASEAKPKAQIEADLKAKKEEIEKKRQEALKKGEEEAVKMGLPAGIVWDAEETNKEYDKELVKVLQQEMEQLGKMLFDFTAEEQKILKQYAPEAVPTVETGKVSDIFQPVTEDLKTTKEDEAANNQGEQNQEAAQLQQIENVRENYVYLGIHDTEYTLEDQNKTRLTDENVNFVFSLIDRIENSVSSSDMRSLGYNLLMHSGREIFNRIGLDIQPKETIEEFTEQFRVNGILTLPQNQIDALFKNPNAIEKIKLGLITNENGEPLFFDKTGQKVTIGTPVITSIGQVYEQEMDKGGKTSDAQFKASIPAEGQIVVLSRFINGKALVRQPLSAKDSNDLILHRGKEEAVTIGDKVYTLQPGVPYLKTNNSNFPYRVIRTKYNTKEDAENIVALIEAYNNARLNPEESTLSDYFKTMSPQMFIKYLYNYAYIPKNSSNSNWGITPVYLKGEKEPRIVRIYNNKKRDLDIPREEAINLVFSNGKNYGSPSNEFFDGDVEFRPFSVEVGKVKTGKAINFKVWFGDFRKSGAAVMGVANRNLAFEKQDVRNLSEPAAKVETPTTVAIANFFPESPVAQAPVSDIEISKSKDSVNDTPILKSAASNFETLYIPRKVYELAYENDEINKTRSGGAQTLERIIQRGGYTIEELDKLFPKWKEVADIEKRRQETLNDNKDNKPYTEKDFTDYNEEVNQDLLGKYQFDLNPNSSDEEDLIIVNTLQEGIDKINAKYDAKLEALTGKPEVAILEDPGKLPNDIKEEFKGKFIYATPGAGKTTLAQGMQGVVDTDVLIVEEMKKRHPDFFAEAGESIQSFIYRYVNTHDHKGEINQIVLNQAKQLANQGYTILTGTTAFINDADIVITAPVTLERVAQRFKTAQAAETFANKEAEEIKKAGKTAQPITNFLEYYLTNKGYTDPTTPPSNLPTIRGKRGKGDSLTLERSKLYARQITAAQEKAAELWVNTVGKKAFGNNRYLIEQLLTNPEAWATWSQFAGMVLFADGNYADLYHESWHEFTQLYFTPKQREALYKLAAKIYGSQPQEELEERLAEDFRQFMLTGVMPESIQKYKDARTTFQKIADFLKNLFSNKKTVDRYFENLAKGKVGKKIGKPGFKTLNSAKALSLYDNNGNLTTLSFEESKRYLDMIDEMFVMVGNNMAIQAKADEIAQSPEAARGISYVNLMYSPSNIESIYDEIYDYFAALEDESAEVQDVVAQQQFATIFGIDNKNIEQIFNYHKRNSSLYTPEMITELEELEQEDLTDTNLIKDEIGKKSQLELAPPIVINLIRSIPRVDSKGILITNPLTDAPMFGDFTENWNILKNVLSGATDYAEMLQRIEKIIPEYPQFQYLLDRLPVKITLDSAQQLRNSFFNAMSLEKVEGIQGVFNSEGKFSVNNTGTLDTKRVRDLWSLQFTTEKKGKFKTPSAVTRNFVLSPEIFTEYPQAPKSPEDVLAFLKEIGFNYSSRAQQAFLKNFNQLRPKFEYVYEKLKDVVLNSGTEVADPFLAIRQEHINQNTGQSVKGKSYDLDRLVELESLHNLSFANDMVQVADGTSKFITNPPTYQTKVVAALNDPKYKYFEDLFDEYPELDPSMNWGLANSAYLAYLFDFTSETVVDGKIKHKRNTKDGKPVSLQVVSLDGITAEEDYGFNQKTIDLEDPEKHLADVKTLLSPYGRVEENNRIGEKSTTRGLMLSSDTYFLYNRDSYYQNNRFSPNSQVWNIIYNYLEAEAKITDRESISENFNKNKFFEGTPQLAYFSEILSPELRSEVYEFFKTKTVEDFEESALKELVKQDFNNWIANAAMTSQRLLAKFEDYKVKGKNNDFQVSLDELKRYHTLSMIHRIEQYKLFNYHPYYYKNAKDVEKRIPAFNASGLFSVIDRENLDYTEASLTMQNAFKNYADKTGIETLQRKGGLEDITYLVIEDEALDSQTARENKEDYGIHYNSYAETKKKVDVQDAASIITLDFFRKFYATSKGLTSDMKKELDRQATIWTNHLALKVNPANAEARENLNKALNTNPFYVFSVKKLQYAGPGKAPGEVVPVFHKYSNKILLPSEMVDNEELFNIAVKLHSSNADYLVFKTGTKIAETVKPVKLFYNGKVDKSAQETGVISLRYLKEQQEVEHKEDNLIIFATQFRKLLFKDVTTDKEKDLLKVYKTYIKELTGYDIDKFSNKIEDKKAAVEFLIKELDKKNVSAVTKDLIRIKEQTGELEYAVDSLIERTLAENAITSAIKKSIIRQKFNGTQFVQFPVSLVRPDRKLKFYRIEDGEIASAEAIISFSSKYYSLLNLPFDSKSTIGQLKKEGDKLVVVNPYEALKRLNQKLKDPAFRKEFKDSLTLAGVRIPVQGYNSMEKMEIVEFLPEESGDIILVPDELVVKSGGDFDIDKLFMYEPVLKNGRILTEENSAAKELERLANLPEGRTREEIEKGAALTRSTVEEYMAKTGFTIADSEDVRKATNRKQFLEALVEKEQRDILQNKLLDVIRKRLSQPEIFQDLIEPNNVNELDEYAKSAPEYLSGDTNKIIKDSSGRDMWSNLVNPHYQLYVYQLAHAMEMVGVSAKANTFQSAVQDAKLEIIDKNAIDLIYFDTNKNSEGHIKLWEIYDVDKKNKISQIISQLISGSVDVVKNDNILKNNINPNTVSVALYLNMMGVRYKDINTFLKDEAIYRLSKGESFQDILRTNFREFYNDYAKFTMEGGFSNYATAKAILESADKNTLLTDKTSKGSLVRLAQFVILKSQQGNYLTPLIIGTDFDTQSIRNFESAIRKEEDIVEVYKSKFFNKEGLDNLVYDSAVAPFRISSSFIKKFESIFPISANKGLIKFISSEFKSLQKQKTWIDYDNFSRRFKNALLTSILETNADEFMQYANYLKVDPSVKNLEDMLSEIKTEAAENGAYIPLLDSIYFTGNINSNYIAPAVFRNDNNLDVDVKKEQFKANLNWDSTREQEVSQEFRKKVREFFRIFAYTGIISTQLNKTHGSFLEIIPEEIYTPVVDEFVKTTSADIAKGKDSEFLKKFYNRFVYNNPDIFSFRAFQRVANPSLKFYRNYDLNVSEEQVQSEYPNMVEKVKPSPVPVPAMKEAMFIEPSEEIRKEPLPEVKTETTEDIDNLTRQSITDFLGSISDNKPVDQDIIKKINELPDNESDCK